MCFQELVSVFKVVEHISKTMVEEKLARAPSLSTFPSSYNPPRVGLRVHTLVTLIEYLKSFLFSKSV